MITGNVGVLRELLQLALLEDARHDALHPARKIPRHVGNGFALAQPRHRVIQKDGRAAQAAHAHLESHARAQRRLLQNQRQEAPGQRVPYCSGCALTSAAS